MSTIFNIKIRILLFLIFLTSLNLFSQQKTISHKVVEGENIISISKEYNVKPELIYELNPDSKYAIKVNSVLLIPLQNKNFATPKTHIVKSKETVFGISKLYKISIIDLKKWNPILETEELKLGQELHLIKQETNADKIVTQKTILHEVAPKETKYSISRKFNISIEDLEKLNPDISTNLPIGIKIKIPTENLISENNSKKESLSVKNLSSKISVNKLIARAKDQINVSYKSGGNNHDGFDCSGLMVYTFENTEIKLPRTSFEQSKLGIIIEKSEAIIGDLIFFGTNGIAQINHVGLIVEVNANEIKFIHSTIHSGVIISSTIELYYKKDFIQINRLLE
ncbi:MAG: C40 family peptidase [Flavobacterium sp.]|nr:C40 family peptidase [Flavobacterium sp.]